MKKHVYPLQYGFAVISLDRKTFQPRGSNKNPLEIVLAMKSLSSLFFLK
jgi:hypothetical protein